MDNGRGTTLYEYQLAMLHPMCDSAPCQAQALLDTLGATRADTAAAWTQLVEQRRRTSIAEYEAAWGAPVWKTVDNSQDHEVHTARWDLTFWPDLQLEYTAYPHNLVVFRNLVRRPDAPGPSLRTVADLAPWSCTARELDESVFGPLDHIDGFGGRGDLAAISAKDPDSGLDRLYWVNIDFGLLQSIEAPPEVYL
ncbi:hypothetical protein [Nocardia heshunensis]